MYENLCLSVPLIPPAGFYTTKIPFWIEWLKYLTPFRYGFEAMVKVEFGLGPPYQYVITLLDYTLFPNEITLCNRLTAEYQQQQKHS